MNFDFYENFEGKHVIIRSYDSGVHFGILKKYDQHTKHVLLLNSRRLYRWVSKGASLSEIANEGLVEKSKTTGYESKITQVLPEIIIANVIEIIPCTEIAIKSISEFKAYDAGNY